MIQTVIQGIKIAGVAAAVSGKWTPLTFFAHDEREEKKIRRFMKHTGVQGRYDAGKRQTASDFCFAAAKKIIEEKNVDPNEIGILIFVTQTPDYQSPASACVLQHRLGLSKDCIAFDVNLGCSGFTYGINIVASLMKGNNVKKALLLCGDTIAKKSNTNTLESSHAAYMLWGDAGTATLLEETERGEILHMACSTDGSGFKAIITPYEGNRNPVKPSSDEQSGQMEDVDVLNFATAEVPEMIRKIMERMHTTVDDYDALVLHQANLLVINQVAKEVGFSPEKTLISIDEFGNTASATIPSTLVKHFGEIRDHKRIRVMMAGFGVGLSWSVVDACMNTSDIFELVHTDEFFEDGFYVG